MRQAIHRRIEALEQKYGPQALPWLVIGPDTPRPEGWEKQYGGIATWEVVEGRQPFPIYQGERLKPSAWPNHLLVPMDGLRPLGEPLPYCLERIP